MARKKKKLTRKQLKQQRQEAIARKREEKGWKEPRKPVKSHEQELLDDMLPLFPLVGEVPASPEASLEPLMRVLLDSDELAEEPEFEDIIIDPVNCVQTFTEIGEELGMDPDKFFDLPDEEREDSYFEMLEQLTERLVTDKIRQDIIEGLKKLRLRLKRSGQQEKVAQVAALQSILPSEEGRPMWPMIGLVQAIVHRSLTAGFELFALSMEAVEQGDIDESDTPRSLAQRLAQSAIGQKADALLKKVPGLGGFLAKESDKIWDEGEQALFEGELYLELYSDEELEAAAEIFAEVLEIDPDVETSAPEKDRLELNAETGKTLMNRIDDYITNLFTPERLSRLRTRLDTVLTDPSHPQKWLPFKVMLIEYMKDEEAVTNEKRLLIQALFGEMRIAEQLLFEETGTE